MTVDGTTLAADSAARADHSTPAPPIDLDDLPELLCMLPAGWPVLAFCDAMRSAGTLGFVPVERVAELPSESLGRHLGMWWDGTHSIPKSCSTRAIVVARPELIDAARALGGLVLCQVRSRDEAARAVARGARALIAKGSEAAGEVGEISGFILLQQLLQEGLGPLWLQGGVGPCGAAGARLVGARGVVLESQLEGLAEARGAVDPLDVRGLDGTESHVEHGNRVWSPSRSASPSRAVDQGIAFAEDLCRRHDGLSAALTDWRRRVQAVLASTTQSAPLHARNAFCEQYGLAFPVLQGPMTRVSDVPAFAAAVSEAGALPFVALSLLDVETAASLLQETQRGLAGRPWGVGLLGFAPAELREQQLALLRTQRPTCCIISGGTALQARALEAEGIATFLHAPSRRILQQMLKEGARRFILEGSECGGHVGPRTSLVHWEDGVRVLLQHGARDLDVVLAGGIHDGLSAAFASAFLTPLARQGARVAVLMGSAYLRTVEACESGAISPAFQDVALSCRRTRLLKTRPGHVIRAAQTPYVEQFEQLRQTLSGQGRAPDQLASALEESVMGRLRIATKHSVRERGAIRAVSDQEQLEQGLFMIGDVATLGRPQVPMRDLHADVVQGSQRILQAVRRPPVARETQGDLAIVGIACMFPGCEDLSAYWQAILEGRDCVTEVPESRWRHAAYLGQPGEADKTPSKWGGFIPSTGFDPSAYGIPPASLASIDPVQLLALKVVDAALADSGIALTPSVRERTGIVMGADSSIDLGAGYILRAFAPQLFGATPEALDRQLPRLTEDSFPGVLANVIAGRAANRLDLGGPNYTVNAACASSLAALDAACKELRSGRAEVMVAGAADLHNSAYDYLMFSSVRALSPTGRCRTFSSRADGIVLGEGVCALVLMRLDDAIAQRRRVYAVLRGVGSSSDGRSLGLTAPNRKGQAQALARAYQDARTDAATVGLLEAHGTGTVAGDQAELSCLTDFLLDAGAAPGRCALGSVKSQIGHTKCASGFAGLIKAALSIHHGVIPPTLHSQPHNPAYVAERSPFYLPERARPWLAEERIAGVSAFGFGGTNFHAVLSSSTSEPIAVGGRGCSARAASTDQPAPPDETESKVAFLFPGQGGLRAGALQDLFVRFPKYRRHLTEAIDVAAALFPTAAEAAPASLQQTEVTQPALGVVELAAAELLRDCGLIPDMLAGHSYGELVALAESGAIAREDLVRLSRTRAACIRDVCAPGVGAMLAVRASVERIRACLGAGYETVSIASHNAPSQVVLSGGLEAMNDAARTLRASDIASVPLQVSHAFHSTLLKGAAQAFEPHARAAVHSGPAIPTWSNLTGRRHVDAPERVAEALSQQLEASVRFTDQIEDMYLAGARVFVEVGPGRTLTDLVGAILGDRPHHAIALDPDGRGQAEALLGAIARISEVTGRELRVPSEADDPTRQQPARPTSGAQFRVEGHGVTDPRGVPLQRWAQSPLALPGVQGAPSEPHGTVLAYLDAARAHMEAQRDVMIAYLRGTGNAAVPVQPEAPIDAAVPRSGSPARLAEVERAAASVLDVVRQVIADRTGYPADVLEAHLDLEADLGIDSIKRTEIVAEIGERLGIAFDGGEEPISAGQARSVTALVEWCEPRRKGRPTPGSAPSPEPARAPATPSRFLLTRSPMALELPDPDPALARPDLGRVVVVGPGPIWTEGLCDALRGTGISASTGSQSAWDGATIVDVHAMAGPLDPALELAPTLQALMQGNARGLLALQPHPAASRAEDACGGLTALVRSAVLEAPGLAARVVELDGAIGMAALARLIRRELEAGLTGAAAQPVIAYEGEVRCVPSLHPAPLDLSTPRTALGTDSVVLVVGGARGVGAHCAQALFERTACVLELVGRARWPEPEWVEAHRQDQTLEEVRARMGSASSMPASELQTASLERFRALQVYRTVTELRDLGADVRYRVADISSTAQVEALLSDVVAQRGRLDGVVLSHGVIQDRRLTEKDTEEFERVYRTKVDGARNVLQQLPASTRFALLFSSTAGVFGSAGQADYAAANEALDRMAASSGGAREVRSIAWGPWAGVGMVTPSLVRHFERQGVKLLEPRSASAAFVDELLYGRDRRVVWTG